MALDKPHEIERVAQVLKEEARRDAKKMGPLLLGKTQPDVERMDEAAMVDLARRSWGDQTWRMRTQQRMSPEAFLKLSSQVLGVPLPPELGGPKAESEEVMGDVYDG